MQGPEGLQASVLEDTFKGVVEAVAARALPSHPAW